MKTKALLLLASTASGYKPPVESGKIQDRISQEALVGTLQTLNDIAYAHGGNRAFGLPGYDASVDFVFGEISKLDGFRAWKQNFSALFTQTTAAEVSVDGGDLRTVALTYTPSTPEKGVVRELVRGPDGPDGCDVAAYTGLDAASKIVLVERGPCPDGSTFAGKVKAAADAGAVAVVLYNSDPSHLTGGTLSSPDPDEYVPAALIDQEPGRALVARLGAGERVEALVRIVQLIEERPTQNVFAETLGGDGRNVVLLGAHLDSVQAGPGVNDDGSGTALILETARALQHFSTDLRVRFAWWGAEENGMLGSQHYADKLATGEIDDDILLYLNFDMVSRGFYGVFDGTGNKTGPGGPPGSDEIERLFSEHLVGRGLDVMPVGLTGGTDYVPFLHTLHKPVGGLFTGVRPEQDPCYHQACDNITNPVPETLLTNARAAAHVLSILATNGTDLIPKTQSIPLDPVGDLKKREGPARELRPWGVPL